MGFFNKISSGLKKTRESFTGALNNVMKNFTKVDEAFFEEIEEILILADTGVPTAQSICAELKDRVKLAKEEDPEAIKLMLSEIIGEILAKNNQLDLSTKPSVVLIIGVNGVGKTTSIGKLAALIKSNDKSVLLAAADTFRAAAIEQLEAWAQRADVGIIKAEQGSDPAAVVFDSITAAKARNTDVLICDTAGRLHNKKHLMDELAKIRRIIQRELPDSSIETLLVLDASTGQNAVSQAKNFAEVADITGIILTKLDGTAKGGVAIAICSELDVPVKYICVGEAIDDIQPFNAEQYTLAMFSEQTEAALDEESE